MVKQVVYSSGGEGTTGHSATKTVCTESESVPKTNTHMFKRRSEGPRDSKKSPLDP
jgi:hypothetical protein